MVTLTIGKNDAGQRIDRFLVKIYHNLPISIINKAIRKKDIKINGKRCQNNTFLTEGDEVSLYIHDKFLGTAEIMLDFLSAPTAALPPDFIAFENNDLIIAYKPAGLLTHPDGSDFVNTLISSVLKYLYTKGEYVPEQEHSFSPAPCNRLDRNTSGLVIIAKNAKTLRDINDRIKSREIKRYYLCVVEGILDKKSASLKSFHTKNHADNMVSISKNFGNDKKEIITEYSVLAENQTGNLSLLEVQIITGRSHQIRAHLASIGHPIVGDNKYGRHNRFGKSNHTFQLLCSWKIVLEVDGELRDIKIGQPPAFIAKYFEDYILKC